MKMADNVLHLVIYLHQACDRYRDPANTGGALLQEVNIRFNYGFMMPGRITHIERCAGGFAVCMDGDPAGMVFTGWEVVDVEEI